MKHIYLVIAVVSSVIGTQNNKLFAQDKQTDFKLGNGEHVYSLDRSGEEEFFLTYGNEFQSGLSSKTKKNVMKFDKNLRPLWSNPVSIETGNPNADIIYSYFNPADKKEFTYLYDISIITYYEGITSHVGLVGSEKLIQVLPDGSQKEKKIEIPKKELRNIASVFTDSKGLNIITLNGEKKFPTGSMNWYVFSHDQLVMTKKNILLPLPEGIDKNNESDWRLSQVTPNGLYFSYVSYKNKIKEPGSILTFNIIKVTDSGPGKITTIDLNREKYTMLPVYYTQSLFSTANPLRMWEASWKHNSESNVLLPESLSPLGGTFTDNSYLGIQVDAINDRIYTISAVNDDFKPDRDGYPGYANSMIGKAYPITALEATVFDMSGKKINQTIVNCKLAPEAMAANWNYTSNIVSINLLQNNEGVVFKAMNNGKGYIFSLDKEGKIASQNKFDVYGYIDMTTQYYRDAFPAFYNSKKDFEQSPYVANVKSPEYLFFKKIANPTAAYVSLKSGDVFADSKNGIVKLSYFAK